MNTSQQPQKITSRSLITFFLLAFGITWGFSALAAEHLLPGTIPAPLRNISGILLHYGPSLAAITLAGITGGRKALRSLLAKLGHWRVGLAWYLFVFFYPLLLRLAAVAIDVLLGGDWPPFLNAADVPQGNPVLLLPGVFLVVFFQAGLAEEIGWRGYGLPGLQQRYGALASSLILGILWWLWHFHPLNFGHLWPIASWYLYNILATTILLTWIYNSTQGSILLVVLFHTASNVCDWIVPTSPAVAGISSIRPTIIQGTLAWIFAAGLIARFGAKQLSRQGAAPN